MIALTNGEASLLLMILEKHNILVKYGKLPELLMTRGEASQIENKLLSAASIDDEFNGEIQ